MNTSPVELVSIFGAGHSGSTLLDMIIGSHKAAFSLGEISRFNEYVNNKQRCTCGLCVTKCPIWSQVLEYLGQSGYRIERLSDRFIVSRHCSDDRFFVRMGHFLSIVMFLVPFNKRQNALRFICPETYARMCNAHQLYDTICAITQCQLVVDSSKSVHRFRLLQSLRPESTRGIFLTRDGRAVMNSLVNRAGLAPEEAARKWLHGQRYVLSMLRTLPSRRYIHVRYEALCRDTEVTVRGICDFLEIPFHSQMLAFREHMHHNIGGNRMRFGKTQSIKESVSWRVEIDEEMQKDFEQIAGSLNRRLLGDYYVS